MDFFFRVENIFDAVSIASRSLFFVSFRLFRFVFLWSHIPGHHVYNVVVGAAVAVATVGWWLLPFLKCFRIDSFAFISLALLTPHVSTEYFFFVFSLFASLLCLCLFVRFERKNTLMVLTGVCFILSNDWVCVCVLRCSFNRIWNEWRTSHN